jgi:hypothetical protein
LELTPVSLDIAESTSESPVILQAGGVQPSMRKEYTLRVWIRQIRDRLLWRQGK